MSDFIERLVAADPVAAKPYEHQDLAAMTTRISAQPRLRPRSVLQTFRVRIASAVALASVLSVSAIAALQSAGPGLAVLTFGSSTPVAFANSASISAMKTSRAMSFVAGPALGSSAANATAFRLDVASNAAKEASRIATVFAVHGSPTEQLNSRGTWSVYGRSGAVVTFHGSSVPPRWTYSNGSSAPIFNRTTPASAPSSVTLTHSLRNFIATSSRYVDRLRLGYEIGRARIAWTSNPNLAATAPGPLNRQVITFAVKVGGVATDQSVTFMFDASGRLLWSSGPDFGVTNSVSYPLVSPIGAVGALNAQQPPAGSAIRDAQSKVTLMSNALTLRTFHLANGTDWMLPTYVFSQIMGGPTTRWWIVAIQPRFLRARSASLSGTLASGSPPYP
ncbi:MAG: hypothetical protein HKL86_02925 [Acidimicrobiaceae bacterium]|nr:hypothetical protein [Acidimicrobiaceae bacterium]